MDVEDSCRVGGQRGGKDATEAQLRTLVDHVGDAVFLVDPAGGILTWNPAAQKLFGHSLEHARTLTLSDLFVADPTVAEGLAASLREASDGRIERERRLVTSSGARLWASVVIAPVHGSDGELQAFAMIVRDQTALHEARTLLALRTAELERSNKELEAFAGVASHDLQEPLRKIRTFADRLRKRSVPALGADAVQVVDRIDDAATRMQRLIDSILGYAMLARGTRQLALVDLNKVARAVRSDLEPRIELTPGVTIDIGPLPTIEAEPTQMHQLLQNLLGNALKFVRPEVAPVITVTSERSRDGWSIRVEDNGIGFEPRHAERIFGPLQRLHGRHEYEGAGMGLAICRRIVESHGGTIVAEGRAGLGASFAVWLPERQRERDTNATPRGHHDPRRG